MRIASAIIAAACLTAQAADVDLGRLSDLYAVSAVEGVAYFTLAAGSASYTPDAIGGWTTNYTEGGTNWWAHIYTNAQVVTNFVVPSGSLSCEVLIVAGGGGGGGGQYHAGGGGGGGLLFRALTLSGTNSVFVGMGGAGGRRARGAVLALAAVAPLQAL